MSKTMTVELVTPQRPVLSQEAEEVVLPGAEGSLGVLPGHMQMVTLLGPGMLKIKAPASEKIFAVSGGYAEISARKVVILADTAEAADEIDLEAVRRERDQALAQLKKGVRGPEWEQGELALKKALAQLQVAHILRNKKDRRR